MKHVVHHDLGQEKAKEVAQAAFSAYRERYAAYNPVANWTSDRHAQIAFSVKGMTLNGSIEVAPSTIELDLDVPFMLRPFKGQALSVIEQELNKWIGKAKTGQLR